jgi:hydrogenase expression/formation protein HypC
MCLGIPGRIVEIVDAEQQRAVADVDGVRREISVALLGVGGDHPVVIGEASGDEAVVVGDWVLIHVGFAMSRIDEDEANETLRALQVLGEAYEQEMADFGADGEIDPLAGLDLTLPSSPPDGDAGVPAGDPETDGDERVEPTSAETEPR